MRIVLCIAALAAPAPADTPTDTSRDEAVPGTNHVSFQSGLLPNLSLVGVEYVRVFHRHFEVGASVSYGLTADAVLTPRMRWPWDRWVLAFGVGPSVAYEKGLAFERSRWFGQLLADVELTYQTSDDWLLQLRAGATVFRDRPEMIMPGDLHVVPLFGLGIGRAL